MSDANIEQIRATARQLAERAKNDPAFKQQIEKDPVGTLTSEGLPEEAASQFLREAEINDVAGYAADTICPLSCLIATL